jgi:hypothetical protein
MAVYKKENKIKIWEHIIGKEILLEIELFTGFKVYTYNTFLKSIIVY